MKTQIFNSRLGAFARGLAILLLLSSSSMVSALDITVTGTIDTADPPGACTVAGTVTCPSLRSAIRYANETSPDADTITLNAGTYTLSLDGVDETFSGAGTEADPYIAVITPDATQGDLDITDSLTISGETDVDGKLLTTITWDEKNIVDPNIGDRIFHVQALSTGPAVSVTLSELILSNGSVGVVPNTDCTVQDYPYDIEVIPGELCNIWQFRRYGGALAIGSGAGIAFYEEAIHGPDTPGGGGNKPPDVGPGGDEGEGGVITGVTINRVAVINSSAGADAGGIYNAAPTDIIESAISGNFSGANGGGIYNDAEMTIENTLIGTAGSSSLLADTALLANPNQGENGGALFDTGFHTTTINASAINGNTAIGGGGIAGRALIVFNITNTTISGNLATDVGGGITTNGTINLKNSTIVGNEASTDAPGGGAGLNSFGSGTYNLHNSIVADNIKNTTVDSNCGCSGGSVTCPAGRIVSLGYNIENADTCQLAFTNDLPNTDPLLLALADNGGLTETHALQHTANGDAVSSPAVDTGDNVNCPNNDQRGSIRPADGNLDGSFDCDIGAFELFVETADLHIQNLVAPDLVNKGDQVTVTLEVHNPPDATAAATDVLISATVPTGFSAVSGSLLAANDCTVAGADVTCPVIPSLAIDQVQTLTLVFTAANAGDFTVAANVSAATPVDNIPGNNSASADITVLGDSDLSLTLSTAQTSVFVGDNVTVTVNVNNAGPDDASGARVGFTLPPELTYISGTPDNGSTCSELDGEVACILGDILTADPDVNVTLLVNPASAGTYTLSGGASADQNDPVPNNNQGALNITALGDSDLSLTVSTAQTSNFVGDDITVTVNVNNAGPDDASGGTLGVTLPPQLAYISATPDNGSTCSELNGVVTCILGDILTADPDVNVTLLVNPASAGTYTLSGGASADQRDPDSSNNQAAVDITVLGDSDLSLSVTTTQTDFNVGQNVTVTVNMNNAGPEDASGATLEFTLPPQLDYISATPDNGSTCSELNGVVTCIVGDISTASPDVNVTVSVNLASAGTFTLSGGASADQRDPDPSNNQGTVTINAFAKDDDNIFERVFGCTTGEGDAFDPTLLLLVIGSLLLLNRKELIKLVFRR